MDFLKEHLPLITLIIAVIALVQHWVIALLKRVFHPGAIDVYETGNTEIGFCELGHAVGMTGTLRAVGIDMFVRRMKLIVTNETEKVAHTFEWDLFRERKITMGREKGQEYMPPSGFMVAEVQPQPFNILFHDIELLSEMRSVFFVVHQAWSKMISGLKPAELEKMHREVANVPEALKDPYKKVYDEFAQTEVFKSCMGKLENLCYWKAGSYAARLVVQTAKPNKSFTRETSFTLSEDEAVALRRNAEKLMLDICDRRTGETYFFAYPRQENMSIA